MVIRIFLADILRIVRIIITRDVFKKPLISLLGLDPTREPASEGVIIALSNHLPGVRFHVMAYPPLALQLDQVSMQG